MNFIKQFLGKDTTETIVSEDINRFKNQKIEENLNLDYKHIDATKNFDELVKDVSALANSAGGLIFLGIEEKEKVLKDKKGRKIWTKIFPGKITWGKPSLTKEQIEHNLRGKIHPWVEGLRIIPIRKSERSGYVIFLIDVPQSENPPHMATPFKRYYKRLNFEVVPMEHYEVADFFNKRRKPLLKLSIEFIKIEIQDSEYTFILRFFIRNEGKAIAKYTRFTVTFNNLEIITLNDRDFTRIDHLRNNKPSIQFDYTEGVFYPGGPKTCIGDVTFKIKDKAYDIKINYDIVAEDMDFLKDEIIFNVDSLENAKTQLEKGEKIGFLR